MKYSPSDFNQGLCQFLDASPTPYHAVASLQTLLEDKGFEQLHEADSWGQLNAGHYFVIREASIIAFTLTGNDLSNTGIRMVGAHTDSPCLKVKPKPEKVQQSLFQLGVEVYGGALLNPWFDRDLSLAGRVSYEDPQGQIAQVIIDFKDPIATIPSLAIHLDREANQNRSINPQLHLPPILAQMDDGDKLDFRALLEQQCRQQHPEINIGRVLDYEMCFYDTQKAAVMGLSADFITSARLDNLLSCYVGLQSLLAADNTRSALLVCNDHEEVGSQSVSGAQGTFLQAVLQRLVDGNEAYQRMVEQSLMISADNAHAIHPNYADKHDAEHGPLLNKGPVIKTNANQRYATSSQTSALFRQLCEQNDVPVQDFVVRTDMACGSTIGPITSSHIGVKTIDIGLPTFAMHSIRELAGSQDAVMLHKVLTAYFNQK
ncbi:MULTISPECIES: M18 family aminopeptidase [unclassified Methylophaga]|jgi:aspartyl aminopeptidase|uniref:M18 family aminopeptidase n=1 Tax=unclassified Methylophaga TaxID=2629249 RepID=UPI00259CC5BB|nr:MULTISPECIES: M18 family aminopeptidase [unclassified Methylophaga]|tara:strand:+ start:6953 stop:8245 length:1293 start_codon:yes stop_codon:yes gene_type:complete